jgi:hypothetical protein
MIPRPVIRREGAFASEYGDNEGIAPEFPLSYRTATGR